MSYLNVLILTGKAYGIKVVEDKPGEPCVSFKLYQKRGSQEREHKQWFPIKVWGPLAAYLARNLKEEGTYVAIRGELEIRQNENGFAWFIKTSQADIAFSPSPPE